MSVSWTAEQKKVIEVRNKNVLVSAAAGSGKTAVLVERILSLVCGDLPGEAPVDVDRLLVVTFTNAAAAEMRERVGLALEQRLEADPENVHLQRQQTLIHSAQITTIHSFCQYVIRNYFHQIDLDPAFRIGDEGELKLLKADVTAALLEERYRENSPEFRSFVETYATGKSDRALEELILQLYEFSVSYPYPERWLSDCMAAYETRDEEGVKTSGWFSFLLTYAGQILEDLKEEMEGGLCICDGPGGPYMYRDALIEDLELLERLGACTSYTEYQEELSELSFAVLSRKKDDSVETEKREQIKKIRDGMKKSLKELKEKYFSVPFEEVLALLEKAAPATRELLAVTRDFAVRYREEKRLKNLADFSDLEHLALEILVEDVRQEKTGLVITPTDAARELSGYYAQLMIDEYQDSNLIQEIILNSVSRAAEGEPNVFMVGDVKQSIYRFRLARPELFLEKYHTYPQSDEGEAIRIDLHKNFRSRSEVLEAANQVFARLMTPKVGGISYDADAALYLGASYEEPEKGSNQPELLVVETDSGESSLETKELNEREAEARAAAERIRKLLKENQVWDKKTEAFRPARPGDIVILLRSLSGWGDTYARILNEEGIPAHTESRTGYFTTIEIQTILNLLRIVDNPLQDIPLAAVLKSMMGGFTDRELALIKSACKDRSFHEACRFYREEGEDEPLREKLKDFYERLADYRSRAEYLSIHEFLWYVLENTGYGDYLAAQPAGEQRRANVRMLIERAIAFEATSYRGLFHFVRYMEQLQSYNEDFGEASILGENEDAVRIMTIHKSKGLEFPIVLVGGLGKSFNRSDSRSRVAVHPDLGLGVDYVDEEKRAKVATLPKRALQKALDLEMLGEELRVLYVAFTRAKEKLILLGSTAKLDEKLERSRTLCEGEGALSFRTLASASTYLDWILPAIMGYHKSLFSFYRVTSADDTEKKQGEEIARALLRANLEHPETLPDGDPEFAAFLKEQLSFCYPYADEAALKAKVSVSELKKMERMDEEKEQQELYPQEMPVPYIPHFMATEERVSGAARGTAYHRVLECLDFKGLYHSSKVQEAMERLVEEGRLSREAADLVRPYDIYAFAQTDLAKRMQKARERGQLFTEQPFVIRMPADEIDPSTKSREPILIQGIIDAFFYEEEKIVVVDYKTDYAEEAQELLQKYKKQLDYYELALVRLTGKQVKEKVLYSFHLKECIQA